VTNIRKDLAPIPIVFRILFIRRMTTFIYAGTTLVVVDMALGEKLFEDIGNLNKLDVKSVHPVEGVKMEVSFTSQIKDLGKFPSGKNIGQE
jgi:hypothetical protein